LVGVVFREDTRAYEGVAGESKKEYAENKLELGVDELVQASVEVGMI